MEEKIKYRNSHKLDAGTQKEKKDEWKQNDRS